MSYMHTNTKDNHSMAHVIFLCGFDFDFSGVNFNDGFGGGSLMSSNLMFNTCRESSDHGVFNSWDRQVYCTDIDQDYDPAAPPDRQFRRQCVKQYDEIRNNFLVGNYHANRGGVDNDDGSAYYNTHHNFMMYGDGGLKSDFAGHDNHHTFNIYAYTGMGISLCDQIAGHEDWYFGNKVVLSKAGASIGKYNCSKEPGNGRVVIHNNDIFTPDGHTNWTCGKPEPNSTVGFVPRADEVIGWAKELIGM